jgi:membrane protease YdiL (CAAX protease family)
MAKSKFNELQFYIIFFVIFLLISNFGTSQMMRQETSTGTMPVIAMLMPAIIQLGLVFLIIWAARSGGNSLSEIGFKTYSWWIDCLIGIGLLAFLLFTVPWLDRFLVDILHLNAIGMGEVTFSPVWVVSGVIIGIAEELIFRGYGYTVLKKYIKHWWIALLVVSLLFGLEHCYKGLAGVAQTFVLALIANGVFIWRKSLIPVAIAHVGVVILLPIV